MSAPTEPEFDPYPYCPPRINIARTYDPLTWQSYLHPEGPWVGLRRRSNADRPEPSMEMSRLELMMDSYVQRRISGTSVLIGGDRGAGKTSMVLKVIERLRSRLANLSVDELNAQYPGTSRDNLKLYEILNFPRPLLVRIHGPRFFDLGSGPQFSRDAMRLLAESLKEAVTQEFAEMFQSRASTPEEHERAAQLQLQLDEGPDAAQLRQVWAMFSGTRHWRQHLAPILCMPSATCQPDQAYREMLALSSSIAICEEIRKQRTFEKDRNPDNRDFGQPPSQATSNFAEATFWKLVSYLLLDGGRLINPIVGLVIGVLVFSALLTSIENFPLSLIIALLSSVVSVVLLNLAAARVRASHLLADDTISSLERGIPILLRRIENAGLFPVITVDELEQVVVSGEMSTEQMDKRMDALISDLKYFVSKQAFTCFIVPRQYYDRASAANSLAPRGVDALCRDKILVTYHPIHLLHFLDQVLSLRDNAYTMNEIQTLAFLKHLYLYRAKGELRALRAAIQMDRTSGETVYLSRRETPRNISLYRDQVFYQVACHAAISQRFPERMLEQEPDRLQALIMVMYRASRIWHSPEDNSFVLQDLLSEKTGHQHYDQPPPDPSISFSMRDSAMQLLGFLRWPHLLRSSDLLNQLPAVFARDLRDLQDVLSDAPLLRIDRSQCEPRYFWTRSPVFDLHTFEHRLDKPEIIRFRSHLERRAAERDLLALHELIMELTEGRITLLGLLQIPGIISYSNSGLLSPQDFRTASLTRPAIVDIELAELYKEVLASMPKLKFLLTIAALHCTAATPAQDIRDLKSIAINHASRGNPSRYLESLIQRRAKTADWHRILRRMRTPELTIDAWALAATALLYRCRES